MLISEGPGIGYVLRHVESDRTGMILLQRHALTASEIVYLVRIRFGRNEYLLSLDHSEPHIAKVLTSLTVFIDEPTEVPNPLPPVPNAKQIASRRHVRLHYDDYNLRKRYAETSVTIEQMAESLQIPVGVLRYVSETDGWERARELHREKAKAETQRRIERFRDLSILNGERSSNEA